MLPHNVTVAVFNKHLKPRACICSKNENMWLHVKCYSKSQPAPMLRERNFCNYQQETSGSLK